tara:strand:+ start:269 stop:448 length:180 start_codon:yes stop_codon:yes gene_type:complete
MEFHWQKLLDVFDWSHIYHSWLYINDKWEGLQFPKSHLGTNFIVSRIYNYHPGGINIPG